MMSVLTTFASTGSRWVLEKVLKFDEKPGRFVDPSILHCLPKLALDRIEQNYQTDEASSKTQKSTGNSPTIRRFRYACEF